MQDIQKYFFNFWYVSASVSGNIRASPTVVIKLLSPNQRGRM